MAARLWHQRLLLAVRAAQLQHRAGGISTALHGAERAPLLGAEPLAELGDEVGFKTGDERGEPDHGVAPRASVKPSIRPLVRSTIGRAPGRERGCQSV